MKTSPSTQSPIGRQLPARLVQASQLLTRAAAGKPALASMMLKNQADARKQHAAIAKLLKMCHSSPVTSTSQGITAEVRRDRDRGHV